MEGEYCNNIKDTPKNLKEQEQVCGKYISMQ